MAKEYNLHSVRIEDEVWRQVKEGGISVNQMLRKALELPWTETRRVTPKDVDDAVSRVTVTRSTVPSLSSSEVALSSDAKRRRQTYRPPLLRPGEKKR